MGAPARAQQSADEVGGETGDDEIAVPKVLGGSVSNTESISQRKAEAIHPITDWLWDLPVIIDDPDAPILKRFRFIGRYHWQYAHVNSNQNNFSGSETRRARFGFDMELLKNITMQSVWKLDGDDAKIDKENIENQWVAWQPREEFGIKIGQQKPLWSQEWSTSSNSMLTMERSLLVNQLRPKHSLGVYVSGGLGQWAYGAGWFDGDLGSRDSSDRNFLVLSLGRSAEDLLPWLDDGRWRIDYLHNDVGNQTHPSEYDYSLASSLSGKLGRWRWVSEVVYAHGTQEDSDVYGLTLMPSIDIIKDQLQFVLRYQLAGSDGDHLTLQDRYEIADGAIGDASGDHYQAYYGGLNWYLRGNRAKLMAGLEYSDMDDPNHNGGDYSGWTLIGGVRISF